MNRGGYSNALGVALDSIIKPVDAMAMERAAGLAFRAMWSARWWSGANPQEYGHNDMLRMGAELAPVTLKSARLFVAYLECRASLRCRDDNQRQLKYAIRAWREAAEVCDLVRGTSAEPSTLRLFHAMLQRMHSDQRAALQAVLDLQGPQAAREALRAWAAPPREGPARARKRPGSPNRTARSSAAPQGAPTGPQ